MEIWEQSDERRIAAAQARWAAEFVTRRPFEGGCCRQCDRDEAPAAGGTAPLAHDDARCRRAA